jgi:hypothetical protein
MGPTPACCPVARAWGSPQALLRNQCVRACANAPLCVSSTRARTHARTHEHTHTHPSAHLCLMMNSIACSPSVSYSGTHSMLVRLQPCARTRGTQHTGRRCCHAAPGVLCTRQVGVTHATDCRTRCQAPCSSDTHTHSHTHQYAPAWPASTRGSWRPARPRAPWGAAQPAGTPSRPAGGVCRVWREQRAAWGAARAHSAGCACGVSFVVPWLHRRRDHHHPCARRVTHTPCVTTRGQAPTLTERW